MHEDYRSYYPPKNGEIALQNDLRVYFQHTQTHTQECGQENATFSTHQVELTQGGQNASYAFIWRSLSAKDPLITGFFCGK